MSVHEGVEFLHIGCDEVKLRDIFRDITRFDFII